MSLVHIWFTSCHRSDSYAVHTASRFTKVSRSVTDLYCDHLCYGQSFGRTPSVDEGKCCSETVVPTYQTKQDIITTRPQYDCLINRKIHFITDVNTMMKVKNFQCVINCNI